MLQEKSNSKKKSKYRFGVISFKSKEELHFYFWLLELQKLKYVKSIEYEPVTFKLTDRELSVQSLTKKDNKVKLKLIPIKHYTPDFKIVWDKKALGKFVQNYEDEDTIYNKSLIFVNSELVSWIDTKGTSDIYNMERLAKSNIAFLYNTQNVYVEIVKPADLFMLTFVPLNIYTAMKKKRGVLLTDYLKSI